MVADFRIGWTNGFHLDLVVSLAAGFFVGDLEAKEQR